MKKEKLLLTLLFISLSLLSQNKVRFIAFTDLHVDIIPDGFQRLKKIKSSAEKNNVDFIIQLGDFAINHTRNDSVFQYWNNMSIPNYSVLGNHDLDINSKHEYCKKIGINKSYYYFDHGDFRFIILDTNFCSNKSGETVDYNNSNYYSSQNKNMINNIQFKWLDSVFNDRNKHYIIFSHTPIDGIIYDNPSLQKARDFFNLKKKDGYTIALVLSGHNHLETFNSISDIIFGQLNGASYISVGETYSNKENYPDSIYKKHPYLAHTIPYEDPLFAIIDIDSQNNKVIIHGCRTKYLGPSPKQISFPDPINKNSNKKIKRSSAISNKTFIYK